MMMYALFVVLLAILCAASSVEAKLGPPRGPQKLHRDAVDSFTAFEHFPGGVAIWDPETGAMLECIAANRTEIDPVTQSATFVWLFPETEHSPKHEVPFYVKAGEKGAFTFTTPGDPTVGQGQYYYSDLNCLLLNIEYEGEQCILWVVTALKDSVPQVCIDHFVDVCGAEVPQHSRDLCFDGEGDY